MNDNRDEIQRLRAMRAEAISRNDFGRADAIGADLARLEANASAGGGAIDPITGMPTAPAPQSAQPAHVPPRRDERPAQGRPAYSESRGAKKTEPAGEEHGGKREEKRRGRFGKAEGKKDAEHAEGREAAPAPRRAAPKPVPAGPSKGARALTVVAAAAIAVSVGATVFSGMRVAESSAIIAKNEANTVNVVVTNRDVAAGETITEADLETQAVPKAYCPTDAATKVSDVAGHTSLTTQTAGNSISLSSIQASSSPAHITSAIGEGRVAIALSLDSSKSLSPLLHVGDRVNVMAVVSDGTTSSAETVCANVKIIALDSALSGSPDAGYSLVTLDVTEDQAAAIVANPNVTLTAIPQTAEGASDAE